MAFAIAAALATPAEVSVYPVPGSQVVPPGAQIAVRGVGVRELNNVAVSGSSTGVHTGRVLADSDGDGGSFLPDKPFKPGETVTVTTGLHIRGAAHGTYRFTVARPAGPVPPSPLSTAPRTGGDVEQYRTEPGLTPAAVTVTKHAASSAPGDIFLAPQQGPLQTGPMILDQDGQLIWFKPLASGTEATDFRVQRYQGNPVLTWWQGSINGGNGVGEDVILDSSYRQIATVRAANGLSADMHEFTLTPRGTALITSYYPVLWDASSVHGDRRQIVLDSVVQEIDVRTGLLLFQWDSLDHVPLSAAYTDVPKQANLPLDYFHVNSIEEGGDGNLVISARNTSAAYKVDRNTGRVLWTLGGKHSSFKMGPGASFALQHDVRISAADNRVITLFDDGGGPPRVNNHSRGLTLRLDLKHKTATRIGEQAQAPPAPADYEGNQQQLPGGGRLIGWGQQPYFSEYDSEGQLVLEGHFVAATDNYRAYLEPWSGQPVSPPVTRASSSGGQTTVYASWNGATAVASWRVLSGSSPTTLKPAATVPKEGFETAVETARQSYVAVQALDANGGVLGTSAPAQA